MLIKSTDLLTPKELFEYLSDLASNRNLVWDCATGNGQAARGLIDYFESVYATDPSEEQLKNSIAHPKITYKIEKAESTTLDAKSVDLITVAQAMHWFDFDMFFSEVKRVLKPKGIIAIWTYGLPKISAEIDQLTLHFQTDVVGEFWQKENQFVSEEYKTIPFPFKEIETPSFKFQKKITLQDLKGLFYSWSATQRYQDKNGTDPLLEIDKELLKLWSESEYNKLATWNIFLRVGSVA